MDWATIGPWAWRPTLVLLGFLAPAGVVFVLAYRHALRHWLIRPGKNLPAAVVATHRGSLRRRSDIRCFHAVAIASAFTSIFVMSGLAVAMVIVAIVAG
jgi:hypothetical protein